VVALVAVAAPLMTTASSEASFPGANGRIVFSGFPNSSTPWEEIYIVNADGTGLQRLTTNNGDKVSDVFPDWAPNGKKFVYQRTPHDGDSELIVMSANGDVLNRLTNNDVTDAMPAWSPDGDKIAFVRFSGSGAHILVKDLSGGGTTHMTDLADVSDYNPEWSPDGNKILFWRDYGDHSDLMTVNVRTGPFGPGAEHSLTSHNGTYDSYPDWAPGGGRVVFSRYSAGLGDTELFIYNVGSGNVSRLTHNSLNDSMPNFSPNGKWIVWARGAGDETPDDLAIRNLGTGATSDLTSGPNRLDQEPDWGVAP
jgi:TolB protein